MLQELAAHTIMEGMPRPPAPKPDEPGALVQVRMDASQLRMLDGLRKHEPDLPSRAEMVRRLVERANSSKRR